MTINIILILMILAPNLLLVIRHFMMLDGSLVDFWTKSKVRRDKYSMPNGYVINWNVSTARSNADFILVILVSLILDLLMVIPCFLTLDGNLILFWTKSKVRSRKYRMPNEQTCKSKVTLQGLYNAHKEERQKLIWATSVVLYSR